MNSLLLTALLALVAKNLVEMLKHFSNVGGSTDSTYTRRKGVYTLAAPLLLAGVSYIAEHQGVSIDLLGQLGVNTSNPAFAAIMSGLVAGLAAPDAYHAQNLLKSKVRVTANTATAIKASHHA